MSKMKMAVLAIVLTICCSAVQAETLYVSVAASMTDAFKELISIYSKDHPDTRILPNFASSGSLAKQINQGAPADLYVSANPKWMKYLLENGVIAQSTDKVFAFNKLVFVGRSTDTISSITDIVSLDKIAVGTPQSVPAGQYAQQAMEKVGVWQDLVDRKKLVMAKDVRQALLYADRGEASGSFVYKTDAMLAKDATILFTVPDELYSRVSYPLGLTTGGAKKDNAISFYRFMATPEAVDILKKYGFEPAE